MAVDSAGRFGFFLRKKEVQQPCELALFVVTPTRLSFFPSIVCARIQSSVNKGARREYFLLLLVVVAYCHAAAVAAAAHSGDSDGSVLFSFRSIYLIQKEFVNVYSSIFKK